MDFHFATAFELIADALPDDPALICGDTTRTWSEFDDRAARIAGVLNAHGLGVDAKVGIYLHNSNEYSEAHHGIFKIRGCPINVNYRYKSDELVYLLDNADAEAVVFQSTYAMRIWEIREKLPRVKLWIQVDDGTESLLHGAIDFERAIRSATPAPRINRPADDVYMLYTGGTTGMPKGVMYPNGAFCQRSRHRRPRTARARRAGNTRRSAGARASDQADGRAAGQPRGVSADARHRTVARHAVADVVRRRGGDDFEARPRSRCVVLARRDAPRHRYRDRWRCIREADARRARCGAGERAAVRPEFAETNHLERRDVEFRDQTGAAQAPRHDADGHDGLHRRRHGEQRVDPRQRRGNREVPVERRRDAYSPTTAASLRRGRVKSARSASAVRCRLGYYKDPKKSAETFREIDGVRYSFPGDFARVEADGTITLLGRGSMCINSAGEKVYPEEVEEVVKRHAAIYDCLVVGVPDDRFGERVVAVASLREGAETDPTALDGIHARAPGELQVAAARHRSSSRCAVRRTARPTTSGPRRRRSRS